MITELQKQTAQAIVNIFETGKALGADEGAVRTIPLRNEGGTLYIALESLVMAAE